MVGRFIPRFSIAAASIACAACLILFTAGLPAAQVQSADQEPTESGNVFGDLRGGLFDESSDTGESGVREASTPEDSQTGQMNARVGRISRQGAGNIRAGPQQAGNPRSDPDDPFLPAGFRAGTWTIFSRLEQAIGYASNADYAPGGEPGMFSRTEGSLRAESNWSRHSARVEARGSLRKPLDTDGAAVPTAGIDGELDFELLDGFSLGFNAGYDYTTESTFADTLGEGVAERPGVHDMRAGVSVSRSGHKLDLTLRGTFERSTYEDALLASGAARDQSDRNNNLYFVAARAGYGATPAFKPFVEVGAGFRDYDLETDRNGNRRDSTILDLRTGLAFDAGEKLSGELAIGYRQASFEDDDLDTIGTPTFNADIQWSPERGTVVRLAAQTEFEISTSAGDSGSSVHTFNIAVDRRIRSNLELNANFGGEITSPASGGGRDVEWQAGIGFEYFVSRYLSFTGDLEHRRNIADDAGDSWRSTGVSLGLALRR